MSDKIISITMEFDDNNLLSDLFGEHEKYLHFIAKELNIKLSTRGNLLHIEGDETCVLVAQMAVNRIYQRLKDKGDNSIDEVDAAIKIARGEISMERSKDKSKNNSKKQRDLALNKDLVSQYTIKGKTFEVRPRTMGQVEYIKKLMKSDIVIGVGPAGTGKTYLAVAYGLSLLQKGEVERLILSRPVVEAGEKLGFLPGDFKEKLDPYMRPLYDALHAQTSLEVIERKIAAGDIEIAPLAYMRGRTLEGAYVILDEAQNTITSQMKMFLTRLGKNSKMVVNGDLTQVDLPKGTVSGLREALTLISDIDGVEVNVFGPSDVVRHSLVSKIIEAYDKKKTMPEY